MTNVNTADNATLKIGSETAKPLWYNDERASSSNTWEEGEVISVYYDGENYKASNAMGGGSAVGKKKLTPLQGYIDNYETTLGAVHTASADKTNYRYIKYPAKEGDVVQISGTGASAARLWGIVGEENVMLDAAAMNLSASDLVLVMPEGTAFITINSKTTSNPEWYYAKAGSVGAHEMLTEAYFYGDLRTLTLGQTYEENEAVKTSDKQLLRVVKEVKAMNITDVIAVGDLKTYGTGTNASTYKALKNVNIYDGTETEGLYAIGRPSLATITVDSSGLAIEEDTDISITIGSITNTITITAAASETKDADIAALIAAAFTTIEGWALTDNEDGTLTLKCNTAGNTTISVSSDTGETGLSITSSTVSGNSTLNQYNNGSWGDVTLAAFAGDYADIGVIDDTKIWQKLNINDLVSLATVQNTLVKTAKAESISYNNSQSGLAADTVQEAIDEVSDAIFDFEYVAATLPAYGVNKWINDNGVWADRGPIRYYLVPVTEGEVYKLTANANGAIQYAFLKNNSTSGAASFVAGTTRNAVPPSSERNISIPAGAAYLYVLYNINGVVRIDSLKIRTIVNSLDRRINELDNDIHDVQTSEERTVTCNLEGYTASNHKTYRMRYNCSTHGRATVSFTAPSNYILKIFCLSSFNAVSDTIDSSNTIVSAQNITPGVTKTITWDDSRAKYIVFSMGNTAATELTEWGVNTFKSSVNLVIEDLIGYDGLDKKVTDLETSVNQLSSLSSDVETLEADVSKLKDLNYENVTVPTSIRKANYWINDSEIWESLNGRIFTLIEASEGDEFYIEGNASESTYMYWLSDYVSPSNRDTPYIVEGTSKFWVSANKSKNFTAPAGTKYLYLLYQITDERSGMPAKLTVKRGGNAPKQESSELYYNGEKISVGNRLQVTLLQQLTDAKSGSTSAEVEGFAVVNGYAAVTRLNGYISLYKLDNEKFYYLFCTGVSAFDSNNAANWGVEKYESSDTVPLLYVSHQGGKTAYVFRVQINGTCTLVQTITISNLPSVYCGEWAIDKERGKLIFYTTSRTNPESGDLETTHKALHRVIVWPVPALRDENEEIVSSVVLNYNEAEEAYIIEEQPNNNTGYDDTVGYVDSEGYYTWVYQGIAAKNGKLIIPCGGYSSKRRRGLRVWDMDARRQINYVDLTNPVYKNHPAWEIEDCDVVDGCVYLFCRGVGGAEWTFANVYKLDFD